MTSAAVNAGLRLHSARRVRPELTNTGSAENCLLALREPRDGEFQTVPRLWTYCCTA